MADSWYEVVSDASLEQGDVIMQCSIYRVSAQPDSQADQVDTFEELHDVVVLTQSCDLENDKVGDVLLAVVRDYRTLVEEEGEASPDIKGRNFRRAAVRGILPSFFLLPEHVEPPAFR